MKGKNMTDSLSDRVVAFLRFLNTPHWRDWRAEHDLPEQFSDERFLLACEERGVIERGYGNKIYPALIDNTQNLPTRGPEEAICRTTPAGLAAVMEHDSVESASTPDNLDVRTGYFSARDLAEKHGVPAPALDQQLRRWRNKCPAGRWIENPDPKRDEATFLYPENAIMHIIDHLRCVGET